MTDFYLWRRYFALAGAIALSAGISWAQTSQPAATRGKNDSSARSDSFSVGNDVSAPVIISAPDPKFPRDSKIVGTVVLAIIVGADGLVHSVKVVRSVSRDLDSNAVAAVKKWKFKPAQKNGKAVAVEVDVEVSFERN